MQTFPQSQCALLNLTKVRKAKEEVQQISEMIVQLWSSLWFHLHFVRVGQMVARREFVGCWRPLCPFVHSAGNGRARKWAEIWTLLAEQDQETMTMTITHSEKSHINQMRAWPYRQECRGHGPTKKNLSYWGSLLLGKVCKYKLLWTECNAS